MRRASRLAIGLMVAVALALAAAVWIMFTDLSRLRADETAGREALAAARSVAPDMLSYDYRTIEQDFARASEYTVGALSLHYRQLARSIAPQARRQKTVQQATVTGAGVESVESGGSGRVEVLLFMSMSTVKTPRGGEGAPPRRQPEPGQIHHDQKGFPVAGLGALHPARRPSAPLIGASLYLIVSKASVWVGLAVGYTGHGSVDRRSIPRLVFDPPRDSASAHTRSGIVSAVVVYAGHPVGKLPGSRLFPGRMSAPRA